MKFIAVSRKMGSNGTEIAKQVAYRLGYKFYETDDVERKAMELGFLADVRKIDGKAPSLFQRLFSDRPSIALARLSSVVYELATKGDAVFLGRVSQVLLKPFSCALIVRATASREKRIQNLVERGYREEVAGHAIEKSDHERSAFVKFAFGVDWDTPELYDMVFNMDKLSVQSAVETVVRLARSNEIEACAVDSLRSLEMLALTRRVEAALAEAGFSHGFSNLVTVSVPGAGKVVLRGFVKDSSSNAALVEVVRSVVGVTAVENKIRPLSEEGN